MTDSASDGKMNWFCCVFWSLLSTVQLHKLKSVLKCQMFRDLSVSDLSMKPDREDEFRIP